MTIAEKYRPNYTYEDYCRWEGRWELIEGMPYAMSPAPFIEHQRILLGLIRELSMSIENSCDKCELIVSPADWKVNDSTVVQPDLMVACGEIKRTFLDFPPSIVVEILSKSTAKKDRNEKYELYQQNDVQYYIIVDPQFNKIEIYQLIEEMYQPVAITPSQFTFSLPNGCNLPVTFNGIWE